MSTIEVHHSILGSEITYHDLRFWRLSLIMRHARKVKIHHLLADRESFYAYYGNTAVDLDPLLVSHARLTAVELSLSETFLKWQRRAKVPPNARCIPSYNFSTQKVNVQRKFTNKLLPFIVMLWIGKTWRSCAMNSRKEVRWRCEVQEEVKTWFKQQAADFYDSGIQKLVPRLNKCLDNAGDYVEI